MVETTLIVAILVGLVSILGLLLFYKRKSTPGKVSEISGGARRRAAVPIRDEDGQILQLEGGPRGRRGGVRLRRTAAPQAQARNIQSTAEDVDDHEDEDGEVDEPQDGEKSALKMGKKKAEKMQAKAEKRLEREAFQRDLEEKKKQREKDEEEARLKSDQEKQEEARLEAEEKKRQEEKERREYEEYLALKASFAVEEEGFDENVEEGSEGNKLQEFIQYIKDTKVVLLEDLAAHFKMKAQDTIDRVTQLSSEGVLTGVIDDRGKFIYISPSELEAVAKFIKQRGRVSISELAENSNTLIALNT